MLQIDALTFGICHIVGVANNTSETNATSRSPQNIGQSVRVSRIALPYVLRQQIREHDKFTGYNKIIFRVEYHSTRE
jgi:hypothetical protein